MNSKRDRLFRGYVAALEKFAKGGRRRDLAEALKLGRAAMGARLGLLDLARIHQRAMRRVLARNRLARAEGLVWRRAEEFCLRLISPFEKTYRDLRQMNRQLKQRQGELEREIQKRLRTEKILQLSVSRLRAVLDNSPALIFLKDTRGRYLHVNQQFERQFGVLLQEVQGRTDREIFSASQAVAFRANDQMVLRAGLAMEFEERARYHDGVHTSIVSKFPLRDPSGRIYALGGITTDITERKRALDALQQSEEHIRLLVSSVKDYAIFRLSTDGRVTSWNPGAERIIGYRENEILGRRFSRFYPPPAVKAGVPDKDLKIALRQGHFEQEGWRLRKDGSPFWASIVVAPIRDGSGRLRGFANVIRDMTERRRAEEALRNLSDMILQAQEEERRRISRELHDEVGQALTAISVSLAAVKNRGAESKHQARTIASAQRLLRETMETVHQFARELRPAMLDELGLLPALRSHIKGFAARTGLRVHFRENPIAEDLNDEQKTALFRIVQESLTNVAKHADATCIHIVIDKLGDGVRMEIADNGKSFREDAENFTPGRKRLGLLGMQERVRLIHGRFAVRARPGKGTTIHVMVPLKSRRARVLETGFEHEPAKSRNLAWG